MEIKIHRSNGDFAVINPQIGASLVELNLAGLSLIDYPEVRPIPWIKTPTTLALY